MTIQAIIAILLTVTAAASYINYRYIKLPSSVGITIIVLIVSLLLIITDKFGLRTSHYTQNLINSIDFNATVMGGMISFLLFAGALHLNAIEIVKQRYVIGVLATASVVISTIIVGFAIWGVSTLFHINIPPIYCFIFGALIAPTDPIAVLGILKQVKAPQSLEMKIAGESLFNDGSGILMFVILTALVTGQAEIAKHQIALLFIQQLCGGILIGFLLGWLTNWLLKRANDFDVSVLITLALVTGGYMAAVELGTSGPIAMAIAGLVVGARLQRDALSKTTAAQLRHFWDLIDKVLNAILFVLIGLAVLHLNFTTNAILVALISIPVVLFARFISVATPISLFSTFRKFNRYTIRIMTWGGLRGGLSIALALSLPNSPVKNEILMATYAVVVFSLIVQGLSIGALIKHGFASKP